MYSAICAQKIAKFKFLSIMILTMWKECSKNIETASDSKKQKQKVKHKKQK